MATTQNLFPTYSVPTIETPAAAQERKYRRSLYFDFDTGDFLQDGAGKIVEADGREAYKQWCMKVAMTEITVDGLTGSGITWTADGEPNKEPKAVMIENGAYTAM